MSAKQQAFRVAKYAYNTLPEKARGQLETILAPITFRLATRGLIKRNQSLGNPPYNPVSIVIPSYNDFRLLKKLIKSIEKTCSAFQYEIIISDDFCDFENTKLLRTLESEKVQVIEGETRKGFAGAVNRGLEVARWDVVLLNSDIVALPYWLENLQAAAYNIDPKIGLVSPHLLYPTGRIQYGGTFHATVVAPQWFAHLDQGRFANYPSANVGKYVVAISGACVYIKKEVLELEPFFDEEYWLGFEDVDYAFSVRSHGYRAYVEPSSKLIHLESATRGKVQGPKEYASMQKFWGKWGLPSTKVDKNQEIVFCLSEKAPVLIKSIACNLSNEAKIAGFSSSIHFVNPQLRIDESAIQCLENSNSVLVALDEASLETVWISGVRSGNIYTHLIDMEISGLRNPSPKSISLLKPEFTHIATSNEMAAALNNLMPWGVRQMMLLPPIRGANKTKIDQLPKVVIVGEKFPTGLSDIIKSKNITNPVVFWSEETLITNLENHNHILFGSIIVLLDEQLNNYLGTSLQNVECAIVLPKNKETSFVLLDGYNSFTYPMGDYNRLFELISWLKNDVGLRMKTISNGKETSDLLLAKYPEVLERELMLKLSS